MAAVTTLLRIIWHFVLVADTWQYMDQAGRKFVLAFPVTQGTTQEGDIKLFIRGNQSTVITVTYLGQTHTHTLGSSVEEIDIPHTTVYSSLAVVESKGVLVESPTDITIYVMRGYEEGFLAIPQTPWSTEFVVISYTPTTGGYSYFTIAAYDKETNVEIKFRQTGTGNCAWEFVPDIPLTITLQEQQVWGIYCDEQDLTGTYIRSNKPISVLSGALIPWSAGGSNLIEFIEEMLIPVDFHGSRFVLPTIAGSSTVLRVVASVDDTTIYADGEIYTYLDAGDYYDIRTEYSNIMCMNGTNPVQVVLLGKDATISPSSSDGVLGDTYMIILPPVESFKNSYEIEFLYSPFGFQLQTNSIFLLETIYADDIIDVVPWTNDSFYESSSCCNYAAVYLVDSTESHFNISRNYSFGVIHIVTYSGGGWGYMEGISLDPASCPVNQGYMFLSASRTCMQESATEVTRSDAESACNDVRASLVQLDTDRKINNVKTHLAPNLTSNSFWIGLKRGEDNLFRWTDSNTVGVTDWVGTEPDAAGECVYLGKSGVEIGWFARTCDIVKGYICQIVLADWRDINLFNVDCNVIPPACPINSGYAYLEVSGICIRSSDTPMSWTDANADCRTSGDHLVTVDTDDKKLQLQTLYRHIWSEYYIGASWHNVTNATFLWTDCSPLVYSNWAPGEPGNHVMSCGSSNTNGTWHSTSCDVALMFVCQKPLSGNDSVLEVTGPNDGVCAEETTSSYSEIPTLTTSTTLISSVDLSTFVTSPTSTLTSTWELTTFVTSPLTSVSSFTMSPTTSVASLDGSIDVTRVTSSTTDIMPTLFETPTISRSLGLSLSTDTSELVSEYQTTYGTTDGYLVFSTPNTEQIGHATQSLSEDDLKTIGTKLVQQTTSLNGVISVQQVTDPYPDQTVSETCQCLCIPKDRLEDLSPSAVKKKDEAIKKELLLNTKNLTRTIAKRTSAQDDRPSAYGIGAMGIALIVFTAALIFGSDLVTLMHHKSNVKMSNRA